MNELSELIKKIGNGEKVTLPKKTYSIAPEDSFHLYGLHFSNTATIEENPDGERFCGIYLENKENVVIDGNGSTVLIHGKMTPFIFKNCSNILMKNFIFDHHRPTMNEFTVTECENGRAKIKINDDFRYEIRQDGLYWLAEDDFRGKPYWELRYKGPKILSNQLTVDTHVIADVHCSVGDEFHGVPDIAEFNEIKKGEIDIRFRDKNTYFKPGTVIQTRSIRRLQTGGAIDDCKNVTLENIRIMSMNGFGILAQNTENVTYKNLDCTPKEGRVIVSDADFFHFSGCSGAVTVSGCKACGAHDDVINIHGTHLKILDLDNKNRTVTLRYSHRESRGFNPYKPGDSIEFVCGNTLQPYFETTVEQVKQLSDAVFAITVKAVPDRVTGDNDVIENTTRTASLTVENNDFSRIPSRAILCTTRKDVIVRNNYIHHIGGPVLCIADDANFWFESGRGGNIYFENNRVEDIGIRELNKSCDVIRYEPVVMDKTCRTPVHQRLTVKNNEFINTNSDEYTLNLNYLGKAEISGNKSNVELKIKTDGIAVIESDF